MDNQEIKYDDTVNLLLKKIPEFKDSKHFGLITDDLELPSVVWGGFASFVHDYIVEHQNLDLDNDPFLGKVFTVVNETYDKGDLEVKNLIVVEVFETLAQDDQTFSIAKKQVKEEFHEWLDKQRENQN